MENKSSNAAGDEGTSSRKPSWWQRRKERKRIRKFNAGYDYAAGALLRGEETPISLEAQWWHNIYADEFDSGVMAATFKLVDLGVIVDDSI